MHPNRSGEPPASGDASSVALSPTGLSVSLTANDLAASVRWYCDILGFTIERDFERDGVRFATRLRGGSVVLLLTQDNGAGGWQRAKGEGFSLNLTTAQNIDDLASRMKSLGAILDAEPADMRGMRVFRLRDPDGFRLVISTERRD